MSKIRVRYAPSPTGQLHIGGARSALFNYLYAKHHDGKFIVRIEDTDIERNIEGGEASQIENLEWLGIVADESPIKPNPKYAPYRQMERLDMYKKVVDELLDKGYAYKCYCTTEELEADYQKQIDAGHISTRYSRTCLNLTAEEKQKFESENKAYTIRIRVPESETYKFEDIIRGTVEFDSKDIGDWVLVKANGIPTYNFAVVVDDHTMEISHVLRGEEHLSNTPKQLMIYKMLGWTPPIYGHMTLITNEAGKKLSKRDETIMQFVSQYKEEGYLPEAMFNFLALLGWSPEVNEEIFTHDKLVDIFDEKRLSKSPSMFDKNKLTWINNRYIKELDEIKIVELCRKYLADAYDLASHDEEWVKQIIYLYQPQLSYGKEIVELVKLFFEDQELEASAKEVLEWETTPILKKVFYNRVKDVDWTVENLKEALNDVKTETGIKGKQLFMGIRVLTTKITHGPDLMTTLYLLGKEKVLENLK